MAAVRIPGVPAFAEHDHPTAAAAMRRIVRGRVLELLEVPFVRPVPDVHLQRPRLGADLAGLPVASMLLVVVRPAQREAAVLHQAARLRDYRPVRQQGRADHPPTTLRLRQMLGKPPAQLATSTGGAPLNSC